MRKRDEIVLTMFIAGILVLICLSLVSATTNVSTCGQNLNQSGSYVLNQSITSTATCLTTNSSNVEIDCAGNTITYGTGGTANSIGISALHPTNSQVNLTIKNCILIKTSVGGSGGNGIMLTRFANSTIVNNTVQNNGVNGNKGIYITTAAGGNNISRNTIITSGTSTTNYGIYLNAGSADSLVEYNDVTAGKSGTTDNYGIRADDPRANLISNIIHTFGSGDSNHGIYSYTSTSARIINNTVYTSGTTGNNIGIFVSTADYNYVANNTINTTGPSSPGIYLLNSGLINVLNNNINSTADGIYITSSGLGDFTNANITRDNTRFGRNITFYGGGTANLPCPNNEIIDNPADGGLKFISCNNVTVQNWYRPNRDTDTLLFVNSDNNRIINNTINGGIHGLAMLNSIALCDNNLIANNTFSSFGYMNSFAIVLYGSYNTITGNNLSTSGIISGNIALNMNNDFNNITNNFITTGGTSGNIGIDFGVAADNNLIQNNTLTTSGTSGNSGIYFESTNVGNIVRNNTITAAGTTSGNLGIRLVTNSNNNLIEYNTFYTKGLTSGNNGIDLSSSSNNIFRFNNVYAGYGTGTTDNDAISMINSKNNTFTNNILFANGTSTSITSSSIFLQRNSANNTFINNNIIKSVGNAIELDFSTTYPHGNIFQNNSLNDITGSDLFFLDANINGTVFINQPIGKYNFTGTGGTISIENTQFGKIVFLSPINGSNGNLSNDIQIDYNFVQANSSKIGLNSSANISFYNLPISFIRPSILKDGAICFDCQNFTSLNAGNVSFSVLSWSNYSIAEYPNLNSPVISSLTLTTTDPLKNDTIQNLTASWLITEADNDPLFNITDWRVNGNSIALLNLPFEAGSSNSTYTEDYSSYGNNGNVSGATLNSTGGYLGGGYFFNADDFITINNGFDYSLGAITFWINEKASATSNSMGIFTKLGNPAYMSDIVTALFSTTVANSAYLGFGVFNNNGIGSQGYAWQYNGLNFYNTGWHHVVIQANSSGNEVYIDGQKVSPTYTSGNSSGTGWLDYPAGNTNFKLGCRMGGTSCLYWLDNATIDDFRIYNRTLSSQQISAIYQNRTNLIVSQELGAGQNWTYCLTASDRAWVSSTNCSNIVTIQSADLSPPNITNFVENPTNGSGYVSDQVYRLNVTISDFSAVSAVWIEWQGVNYTNENITNSGNVYSFLRNNLAAGTYTYKWWANDTLGFLNSSELRIFTISKAVSPLILSSSALWNYTYGTITTLSCSGSSGNKLYQDDIEIINPKIITFAAGTYSIKCNVSETQNYSASSLQQNLNVNKSTTITTLSTSPSTPLVYGTASNFSCSNSLGFDTILYVNGVDKSFENSLNIIRGVGIYIVSCNSTGNQNYSSSSSQDIYVINQDLGDVKLYFNGQENDLTLQSIEQSNITATTLYGNLSVYLNNEDITIQNGINVIRSPGYYNVTAFSSGDENHSSATITRWLNITLDSIPPSIEIVLPQNGATYGNNESLALNFSVYDVNLDSCWYNLGNENITLANCNNITFDIFGNGNYVLKLYANDSYGNLNEKTSIFEVNIDAPSISLISPLDNSYLNYNNVSLKYIPSDIDLSKCELWGDFDGEYKLNQTIVVLSNGGENNFLLNLSDRAYKWNIRCMDFAGHSATNGNKTFHVDTIAPVLSITSPIEKQTSRNNIPLNFNIIENNINNCWYNLSYDSGGVWIPYPGKETAVTITNCSSTSFNVSNDYNYLVYLTATDLAENLNTVNSSFSVDSTTPTPPNNGGGSSGGGGGGSSSYISSKINLAITPIEAIMYSDKEKSLSLNVKNNGARSVNKCKIKSQEQKLLISSDDIKNIAPGEIVDFSFTLTVENTQPKLYLECLEGNVSVPLNVIIVKPSINIRFSQISPKDKNQLLVKYSADSESGVTADLIFSVYSNEKLISKKVQTVELAAGQENKGELILELENPPSGLLKVSVLRDGETKPLIEDSVLYNSATITGFSINSLLTGTNSYVFFMLIIFAVLALVLIIKIIKNIADRRKDKMNNNAITEF